MIIPRFHGHRVKSPSPSLRTRRGNGSQVSNAGGLDYKILQSIRKCPAGLLRGSDSTDDAHISFSAYERSFQPRHSPSSSRANSCSPLGRDQPAPRGTGRRCTETHGPYDAPRGTPVSLPAPAPRRSTARLHRDDTAPRASRPDAGGPPIPHPSAGLMRTDISPGFACSPTAMTMTARKPTSCLSG